MAEAVEIAQQVLVGFHAVTFHPAAPVLILRGLVGMFEDVLHDVALEGTVDLCGKLFFELDFGIQAVHIERNFVQLGQK